MSHVFISSLETIGWMKRMQTELKRMDDNDTFKLIIKN